MKLIINSYLRACTADLANVTIMELGLLGRPFGLLQLALVKCGLLVGVYSRSRHHVAARVAPGRARQLLRRRLHGLLQLLRWRLRLGESLLGRLVVGWGGCGGITSWVIAGVANAWGWESRRTTMRTTVRTKLLKEKHSIYESLTSQQSCKQLAAVQLLQHLDQDGQSQCQTLWKQVIRNLNLN